LVYVNRRIKDVKERRKYKTNFSRLLFLFILNHIDKIKTDTKVIKYMLDKNPNKVKLYASNIPKS
jgi:hypothetical protein